jgi:hypothetical protein
MQKLNVQINAPNFKSAAFKIIGTAPLVIHRFSVKTKLGLAAKQEEGSSAKNRKQREPKDSDETYRESKYVSSQGWEGFHVGAIRSAMISACKLVGFPMTKAKLCVFVQEDGRDALEPQIPLVRIYGKSIKQQDMARVETGQPYIVYRAAYHEWYSVLRIFWDDDQFKVGDVSNLLMRVGMQVGICEGRHDSKKSVGCGWGTFKIESTKEIN